MEPITELFFWHALLLPLLTTLRIDLGNSSHRPAAHFYLLRFFLTFKIPNFTRNTSLTFWLFANSRKKDTYIQEIYFHKIHGGDIMLVYWYSYNPMIYRWRHQGTEMLNVLSRATELITCGVRTWTAVIKPQSLYSWALCWMLHSFITFNHFLGGSNIIKHSNNTENIFKHVCYLNLDLSIIKIYFSECVYLYSYQMVHSMLILWCSTK